ncbi:hypothetical protein ACH5RR_030135 [Cinchona calisaya]|uniref:Wall-associated receptor kinase C-terminal domain-containing protein n=1 Tax=Cinchona calisaya TaxID=153742 RepID=A0ABD2YTQ0_9GENT
MLQIRLENRSCKAFNTSLSLPSTPSISFSINPNMTIFKCSKDQELKYYFTGYTLYDSCGHFNFYYTNTTFQYQPNPGFKKISTLPSNSTAINLLTFSFDTILRNKNQCDLFQLVSAEFSLEWHIARECSECHLKGGQCQIDGNQQFRCANAKKFVCNY